MSKSEISSRRSRYLQGLLASTALVSTSIIHAQQNEGPARTEETGAKANTVDEIIVRGKAQRYRPEDQSTATGLRLKLIDTPQAVTVISPEMMDAVNADNVQEATDLIPGAMRTGSGFGADKIMIRGQIGTEYRINGIQLVGIGRAAPDAYMLERVEAVRGPATVIYGVTGNFGGEFNSILKRPKDQAALTLGIEIGSYDTSRYTLDTTGSLSDSNGVAGRLVVSHQDFGPPIDIPGVDINQSETFALGSLSWDITPATQAAFWVYGADRSIDPYDGGALVLLPNGTLALPHDAFSNVNPDNWYFSLPEQSNQDTTESFVMGQLSHQFGSATYLDATAAVFERDHDISYFFPFGPFGAFGLADDEIYIYTYDVTQTSDDLTFTVSLGGDFELGGQTHQYLAAYEYVDSLSPSEYTQLRSDFGGYARITEGGRGVYADGSTWEPIDRDPAAIARQSFSESTDNKVSLQAFFNFGDRFDALVGAMLHDNSGTSKSTYTRNAPVDPPTSFKTGFSEVSGRLAMAYTLSDGGPIVDQSRAYLSYSEGFQPQSFTDANGDTVNAPREMTQYELGVKWEMFGGAVGAALALYSNEITNITVSSEFLGGLGGFGTFALAGTQETDGFEAEIVGEILPGWNMAANYTYMDSEVIDPNYDFTIRPLTTPRHSGAIVTSYEFLEGPLRGFRIGGVIASASAYSFQSGGVNLDNYGPLIDGSYTRVDLNISYVGFEGVDLYAKFHNVTDEIQMVAKETNPGFGVVYTDQQDFSIGFRYNFLRNR